MNDSWRPTDEIDSFKPTTAALTLKIPFPIRSLSLVAFLHLKYQNELI